MVFRDYFPPDEPVKQHEKKWKGILNLKPTQNKNNLKFLTGVFRPLSHLSRYLGFFSKLR